MWSIDIRLLATGFVWVVGIIILVFMGFICKTLIDIDKAQKDHEKWLGERLK